MVMRYFDGALRREQFYNFMNLLTLKTQKKKRPSASSRLLRKRLS